MSKHGLDLSSGEIWLDECTTSIRPFMSLDDFLREFASAGGFRDPGQLRVQELGWAKPPPICMFKETFRLLHTHLSISLQFSKDEPETLRNIRMFVRPAPLTGISLMGKLQRFLTRKPSLRLPQGFSSMEQELLAYEQWLHAATGQSEHHQTYPWGELMLVNSRDECYMFQINYRNTTARSLA